MSLEDGLGNPGLGKLGLEGLLLVLPWLGGDGCPDGFDDGGDEDGDEGEGIGGGGIPPLGGVGKLLDGELGGGVGVGSGGKVLDLQPVSTSNRLIAAIGSTREALILGRIPLIPALETCLCHFVMINMKIG